MFLDTRTWVDFLHDYEAMVGTRIHGTIAALLAGTPATLISIGTRTQELGEFHEIPTIRLPDLDPEATIASVIEGSDWTGFNRGLRGRYENFCRFLEANGIEHIGQEGKANPAYDAALRAAPLPGPISPIEVNGHLDNRAVLDRLGWLREGIDETRICEERGWFIPEWQGGADNPASVQVTPPVVAPPPTTRALVGELKNRLLRKVHLKR
jgi:hypothetical protein